MGRKVIKRREGKRERTEYERVSLRVDRTESTSERLGRKGGGGTQRGRE